MPVHDMGLDQGAGNGKEKVNLKEKTHGRDNLKLMLIKISMVL